MNLEPTLINGERYYTVKQFAKLVNRETSQIYMLFNQGNKIRQLRGIRVGNKPMILAEEVEDFPFDIRKVQNESGIGGDI